MSNTFVSLFKDTSVATVIAVPELTYGAQWINFNTFRIVEVYAVVTPMYLVTGYAILFPLRRLERRYRGRALSAWTLRHPVAAVPHQGPRRSRSQVSGLVVVLSLLAGVRPRRGARSTARCRCACSSAPTATSSAASRSWS